MKRVIAAFAVAALVGGCVKVDKTPPKDLPAYVKIYPDGQQVMTMNIGPISTEAFTTTASPDDVITFYRNQAASDGLPETSIPAQANANPSQRRAAFGDPAGEKTLVVVTQPQGAATLVTLTYKPAPAQSSS